MPLFIGCAGWSLRKDIVEYFPVDGTHLQRYASRLNCVEINSSFYRAHRKKTYERWAESTPADFRFSVKFPKQITHVNRLIDVDGDTQRFVDEISGLGSKLGPMLVQLPPSLQFDVSTIESFFRAIRQLVSSQIVCEPRHLSWFTPGAEALMTEYCIGRVAADPSIVPGAATPGGCHQTGYFRWHGSPRMYYSAYDEQALNDLAKAASATSTAKDVWCIFDNTALGAAWRNAMTLFDMLHSSAQMDSRRCL